MKIEDLQKSEDGLYIIFYRSRQYRWETTCDPESYDETYHLTKTDAEQAVNKIALNIGFSPNIDEIKININVFNFDSDDEFELCDLDNYRKYNSDIETIFDGNEYVGDDIEGSIIIEWSWEKYVGYCRNLLDIGVAGNYPFQIFKNESCLITGNEESTFKSNYSILLTPQEIDECDDLQIAVEYALDSLLWKWNYFKNNPSSQVISQKILEITEKYDRKKENK